MAETGRTVIANDAENYPAVQFQGLTKQYGNLKALREVDLTVNRGTIFGLVGPNGAGKTTLIRILVGALRSTAGETRVLGKDPLNDRWQLRQAIGYMPQTAALYEDLSARANIVFYSRPHSFDDIQASIEEILAFTELSQRADDLVSTFSGGMKKRVSLACALVHKPQIIFLDEPTAAVDPHLRLKMWALFRELANQGTTLFITTHLMEEALLCDQVAVLRRGSIIAHDRPSTILEAGHARLAVRRGGQVEEKTIPSTPSALADELHPFGLDADIDAISVDTDSLEDVIVAIIEAKGDT